MIKDNSKSKPQINTTIKGMFKKQVIVSMNNTNKNNFMKKSSAHVTKNRMLKNIKINIIVNFVQQDFNDIIIIINKVALTLKLQMIENYIKNTGHINTKGVKTLEFSQSKSYLKIINILYF